METLIVIALAVIAYQLYDIGRVRRQSGSSANVDGSQVTTSPLLPEKDVSSQQSTFNSNDRLTTINSVFSEKDVSSQQSELNKLTEQHSELLSKFMAMEKEEIRKHALGDGTVKDFIPSIGLKDLYLSISNVEYHVKQNADYLRAMIEANIAALNGTPIVEAMETAVKRYPNHFGHIFKRSGDGFKNQIIEERRKSYWEPCWKSIVSEET